LHRGSNGDRSRCGSVPRPGKEGFATAALLEAGLALLHKVPDLFPCTRLALQVGSTAPLFCCTPHSLAPVFIAEHEQDFLLRFPKHPASQ
jgi:hypothetical protein